MQDLPTSQHVMHVPMNVMQHQTVVHVLLYSAISQIVTLV